jgi:hypothetical protein
MYITTKVLALATMAIHVCIPLMLMSAAVSADEAGMDDLTTPDTVAYIPDIVGYIPATSMWDQSRIDLDQDAIQETLADIQTSTASAAEMYDVHQIYQLGGFSKSYAALNLADPLITPISRGTPLMGVNRDGLDVSGWAHDDTPEGSNELNFQYDVLADNRTGSIMALMCHVGGLSEERVSTEGCLDDRSTIEVIDSSPAASLNYSYSFDLNNRNSRTLASFSTGAKTLMHDCPQCPYNTYQKFYDYYGEYDYAHQFITAALVQDTTAFRLGNADLSNYDLAGRAGT